MRKVTLGELEQARRVLAAKRYSCQDGLLQDSLEIAEALIKETIRECEEKHFEYVKLEELE